MACRSHSVQRCIRDSPGCNQGGIAVVESYAIQGSMIGRNDKNGPQGDGINEDVSFTLNTVDRHAVYAMTTGSFTQVAEDKAPTVLARDYKDPTAVCYGIGLSLIHICHHFSAAH